MAGKSLLSEESGKPVRCAVLSSGAILGRVGVFVTKEEARSIVRIFHISVVCTRPGNGHRISVEPVRSQR